MSKIPAKAPARAKPQLGSAALGQLRAASGDQSRGEPIRLSLGSIDVDPNQPRKAFDQAELESLAESIKNRGVLQAIVVRPAVKGRHVLVMGERRFRASRLAGIADIPAIIRKVEDDDFAAQVIENQQRANLSNSELSAAVLRFADEGRTTKDICNICNLKEYQVAAFRKTGEFPAELRTRLDTSDIRALYDLFRQWAKTPDEVIAALPDLGEQLTITEARRIVSSITGKASGSIILDRKIGPTPAQDPASAEPSQRPTPAQFPAAAQSAEGKAQPTNAPAAPAPVSLRTPAEREAGLHDARPGRAPGRVGAPVFIVSTRDGSTGRLVVDRRAERDGWTLVDFDGTAEEVELSELTLDHIE